MRSMLLVWSALWRAQATHLLLFVVVPIIATVLRAASGIVLLPLLLVGFGERNDMGSPEMAHLRDARCWLMLAPCPVAEGTLFPVAWRDGTVASTGPEMEPFLPPPSDVTMRHGWFLAWLLWFVIFLLRRSGRRRE